MWKLKKNRFVLLFCFASASYRSRLQRLKLLCLKSLTSWLGRCGRGRTDAWAAWHKSSPSKKPFLTFLFIGHIYCNKYEKGYRLTAKNERFWSLLILLLSVASIRRKLLKSTYTEERMALQIQKVATFNSDRKKNQIIQKKSFKYYNQ